MADEQPTKSSDDLGYGWAAFKQLWGETWRDTWSFLRRYWIFWALATIAVLVWCFYAVWPYDKDWLAFYRAIGGGKKSATMDWANFIGDSGDLAQYNIIVTAGFWFVGRWAKKRNWQRIAIATFIACLLAGLTCNVFRATLGRPRPSAQIKQELDDRFYGPKPKSHFHGFPSGHTATAFGTAVPVAITSPVVGVPVLAYAGSMGWARMYQYQHHPTDIIVGGYLGVMFGVAAAASVRKRRKGDC
ncbi:phosphatase PAP2 family protein [Sulfuriroseicoccus oceanibius]|uniref:Phosphatase PAP2 family protein n=1 Tax=Sulfuriroseicoccus oceanibius TaxID=2707525 RepID=A0A6B3LFS6_9BACT|nr:phosphatase PAP2 family protein [Sulfuriroseicoccus oceanibius]QQL45911.1 phosphatase PAP2 family protein [Sulfuriroseicoccus oceanibius]